LGELGIRFAPTVAERGLATDLKLVRTDGLDVVGMRNVLVIFEPDGIMQCASLLSPFVLESGAPAAVGIMNAGFALEIAAQRPIIATLMRAHANLGCPAR
jgi:hypothetical protein